MKVAAAAVPLRLVSALTGSIMLIAPLGVSGAPGDIIEKRDPAMAITTFLPSKPHEVKSHWRLAWHRLKLTPYATQSFDRSKTALGIQLTCTTTRPTFTFASVLIVAGGRTLGQFQREWAIGASWAGDTEQTTIESAELVRAVADGKEVYVTVLFEGQQAPFDRISFKLSPEQLEDCRRVVAKYDELLAPMAK
jgi:hypothetical protein